MPNTLKNYINNNFKPCTTKEYQDYIKPILHGEFMNSDISYRAAKDVEITICFPAIGFDINIANVYLTNDDFEDAERGPKGCLLSEAVIETENGEYFYTTWPGFKPELVKVSTINDLWYLGE